VDGLLMVRGAPRQETGDGKGQQEIVFHAVRRLVFCAPRRKWLFGNW